MPFALPGVTYDLLYPTIRAMALEFEIEIRFVCLELVRVDSPDVYNDVKIATFTISQPLVPQVSH
jgi:hypothetical protein